MRTLNTKETIDVCAAGAGVYSYGPTDISIFISDGSGTFSMNTEPGATGEKIIINIGESNFIHINGNQYPIANITLDNVKITTSFYHEKQTFDILIK